MPSMLELQISASRFAESILSTLRRNPFCPPAAFGGMQLQRVRYRAAAIRNDKTASFQISREMGPWDQGLGYVWIEAKQAQLAIDVTIDIVRVSTIAASPNTLAAAEVSIDATVVFDLTCETANPPGWLELTADLAEILLPAVPPLPWGGSAADWARNQLAAVLSIPPLRYDLSDSLPPGRYFQNAGLAVDHGGTRLVLRAELPMNANNDVRWQNFLNGYIPDRLGSNDWSIFCRAADLGSALQTKVREAIRSGLKEDSYRLVTVTISYNPDGAGAVFVITPYIELPWPLGTEAIPIGLTFSLDAKTGRIVVEIDGYGIRDLIDSVSDVLDIVIKLVAPLLAWLLPALLHDIVGDTMHVLSKVLVDAASGKIDGAPKGTTIEEIPGLPFRYRVSMPVPSPPFAQARVNELLATPDGLAYAGTWGVLHFVEGEMTVDVSQFGWRPPKIPCGPAGEAVYRDIADNPLDYATLYGQIALSSTGSAPVRICSVTMLSTPLSPVGIQVSWSMSSLPTTIELAAAAALLGAGTLTPLELEVRTTAGVFRASIPPPKPPTATEIAFLRGAVGVQLKLCDSIILPAWFSGRGSFDLTWIVDPLVDPDRWDTTLDIARLQITGLLPGAIVELTHANGRLLASQVADVRGGVQLSTIWTGGGSVPRASARLPAAIARSRAAQSLRARVKQGQWPQNATMGVTRQRLERRGALLVRDRPIEGVAAWNTMEGQFLLALPGACLLLDASKPLRPAIAREWRIPGMRGIVATRGGILAYGDGGLFIIDDLVRTGGTDVLSREPVLLAAGDRDDLAVALGDGVEIRNVYGGIVSRLPLERPPVGMLVLRGQLLVSDQAQTSVYDIKNQREPRLVESLSGLAGLHFTRSGFGAVGFGHRPDGTIIELRRTKHGWAAASFHYVRPWQADAEASGGIVAYWGQERTVQIFRLVGPPRPIAVFEERLDPAEVR